MDRGVSTIASFPSARTNLLLLLLLFRHFPIKPHTTQILFLLHTNHLYRLSRRIYVEEGGTSSCAVTSSFCQPLCVEMLQSASFRRGSHKQKHRYKKSHRQLLFLLLCCCAVRLRHFPIKHTTSHLYCLSQRIPVKEANMFPGSHVEILERASFRRGTHKKQMTNYNIAIRIPSAPRALLLL